MSVTVRKFVPADQQAARAVIEDARIRELVAHTQPEWEPAVAFYRSHGFAPYGRDNVDVHLRREI